MCCKEKKKIQHPCHSLKQRQLGLIAPGVKSTSTNEKARLSEQGCVCWRRPKDGGSLWEDEIRRCSPTRLSRGLLHPNKEHSREVYFAGKKEDDQRLLEEKARQYYQHEWVLTKDKELRQLQKQEDAATDEDVKHAQQYMMELTVDALMLRFQR